VHQGRLQRPWRGRASLSGLGWTQPSWDRAMPQTQRAVRTHPRILELSRLGQVLVDAAFSASATAPSGHATTHSRRNPARSTVRSAAPPVSRASSTALKKSRCPSWMRATNDQIVPTGRRAAPGFPGGPPHRRGRHHDSVRGPRPGRDTSTRVDEQLADGSATGSPP
jgi:hypothetical protein